MIFPVKSNCVRFTTSSLLRKVPLQLEAFCVVKTLKS